jgi:pimeloyl-ACP methyl ester carboxylesterase
MAAYSGFRKLLGVLMATLVFSGGASHAQPLDRFVTVNGLRIHYLEWGTSGGPPLIMLHGIARTAHNFDHLAPHFSQQCHVIAVDMRGHGDSAWDPQGAYFVEDYVRDVEGLIEQLKLRSIVLWGNSTGGRVAQVFAGSHPELVSAVIVEDVGPERPAAISNRRAKRMSEEENGWASVDELSRNSGRTTRERPIRCYGLSLNMARNLGPTAASFGSAIPQF